MSIASSGSWTRCIAHRPASTASAPKMPIFSDDDLGSMPCRSISSAIASMYDGVTMMMSAEVLDDLHLPFGHAAEIGITVQPSFSRRSARRARP